MDCLCQVSFACPVSSKYLCTWRSSCTYSGFYMIVDPGLNLKFTSVSFNPPLTFARQFQDYKFHHRWQRPRMTSLCCLKYALSLKSLFQTEFRWEVFFPPKNIFLRAFSFIRQQMRKVWWEIPVSDLQQDFVTFHNTYQWWSVRVVSLIQGLLKARFVLFKCFHRGLAWTWCASSWYELIKGVKSDRNIRSYQMLTVFLLQ